MADGIKDKVAIIGMGCTRFGELWDKGFEGLLVEAYEEAIQDAGIEPKDIQAAWYGTHYDETAMGKGATSLSMTLKLPFIPATRVENYCATGSEALRGACYSVAAGAYDITMAIGVEKLKDTGYGGLPNWGTIWGSRGRILSPSGGTAPGVFAMMATCYFAKYGISPQDGKVTLAKISAKSHANGAMHPKAHLRRTVSVEDIVNAPIVAWPLGLFDCCGVSDGSAAAIVCRADMAKNFRPDPIRIKSIQIGVSSGEELMYQEWDGAHAETTFQTAAKAYKEAGIENPREEISLMEVHDCFSITEMTIYEDLQISARGNAKEDIDAGFFNLDGQIPCQPDGGLKCFGHPIGASGLRMMYEVYKQMQGKAQLPERQLKNPKIGLTQNMGGLPCFNVVSIAIAGL